jgi:hypothetical protein
MEGAGNARCFSRTHSLVCSLESIRVSHYRSAASPAFPARVVLTAYLVLTPERPGFVVSVVPQFVDPRDSAPATGAPGLHAFAVRSPRASSNARLTSIAFRLTCRDDRDTSLVARRDDSSVARSYEKRKFNFEKKNYIEKHREFPGCRTGERAATSLTIRWP